MNGKLHSALPWLLGVLLAVLGLATAARWSDQSAILVAMAAIYLVGGSLLGRSHNLRRPGLALAAPILAILLVSSLGADWLERAGTAFFAAAVLAGTFIGLRARALWRDRKASLAAYLAAFGVVIASGSLFVLPALVEEIGESHTTAEITEVEPFVVEGLDGERIASDVLLGKVVVLDFWGVWCLPCIKQMPQLQQVHDLYKDDPRVAFFAVNTGQAGDTPEKARNFIESKGFTLPIAYDSAGLLTRVFGISAVPQSVLMDAKGRIRIRHKGFVGQDFAASLKQDIEALLAEDAG